MSMIYLSETSHPLLQRALQVQGHQLFIIRRTGLTYDPVSSHPDMYMCSLGIGGPVFFGNPDELGPRYPKNVPFNAACTGRFFIHNLKYTSPALLKVTQGIRRIHVSQGYAKCNIAIIDSSSIITSDKGIWNACYNDLDVLLIRPGHIRLQGFSYGFLGGACGRVGNRIFFNGNLKAHPDFKIISSFIESRSLEPVYFPQYPLEDIGSIIEEDW